MSYNYEIVANTGDFNYKKVAEGTIGISNYDSAMKELYSFFKKELKKETHEFSVKLTKKDDQQ